MPIDEKLAKMSSFKQLSVNETFDFCFEKMNNLVFTEKVYFGKIVNQIIDLIVFKFLLLVSKNRDYNLHDFLPDLSQKILELTSWIERKSALLNIALTKGNQPLEQVFYANRNDTFAMGAVRKSGSHVTNRVRVHAAHT